MIKTLNNTIKQDRTAYKIPRSVQDVIPIQRIFADGIFQFGTKYSRTLRFSDINYAIASKEDKTAMFLGYSELLNALDSGSTTKLTICNKQVNRQAFEDTVLLPQRGDSLDGFVDEFNGMLEGKISGSSASVEQERFITVSVHKKNVDEARTFFSRVTGEVSSKLSRLNSSSNELDAAERLDVLRGFFRPDEAALPFDLQSAMKRGHNLKDTICPDSLEFHRDYFKMGSQYGRVLFLKDYASYIKDSMILELTDLNRRMMLSIDMIPVPTDEAVREVENKLLGVETNVTNWQRRQNSNQNFSAVVPYDLEQQRKETREMLDDLTTRDQRMLFAVVTLVHLADSKEELDSDTETLQSIARKHLCQLTTLNWQQADGLVTALPLGLRRIDALGTRVVSLCHLPIFFCIHNLIFHQPQRKNDKHRDDDTDQQKNPALVLLLFFHGIASFLLLLQFLLKKAVHPPYRQKNQRSDQQGTQQIGEHMPQQNLGAVFISPHCIVKKVFQ